LSGEDRNRGSRIGFLRLLVHASTACAR
jgi:hypothetical protein